MKPGLALLLALVPLLATGGRADELVSPSEFREYAEGYTLYFEQDGEPAGAEAFGPDSHVTWQTPEGLCLEGLWRAYGDELCFYYGMDDIVECWHVLRDADGLKVRHADDADGSTYRITGRDRRPLTCEGAEVETRARPELFTPPAPRR